MPRLWVPGLSRPMGYGHGHYSGYTKWRTLGWLGDEQVQIVAGEKIGEVGLTK